MIASMHAINEMFNWLKVRMCDMTAILQPGCLRTNGMGLASISQYSKCGNFSCYDTMTISPQKHILMRTKLHSFI